MDYNLRYVMYSMHNLYNYRKMYAKSVFFIFLLNIGSLSGGIHIIGDSHAAHCFSNNSGISGHEESMFLYSHNVEMRVPFVIDYRTASMHGIGVGGLSSLNISTLGAQDGDVCVFVYGEIDARMHIGRLRDEHQRDLNEMLDALANDYMRTIIANKELLKDLTFVIVSVVPPATNEACQPNPTYPVYGVVEDRVDITKKLNMRLKALAEKNDFLFLDIYPLYADANGVLIYALSDGHVHVNLNSNYRIKNALIELLISKDIHW
jgi:hypothetical protein